MHKKGRESGLREQREWRPRGRKQGDSHSPSLSSCYELALKDVLKMPGPRSLSSWCSQPGGRDEPGTKGHLGGGSIGG